MFSVPISAINLDASNTMIFAVGKSDVFGYHSYRGYVAAFMIQKLSDALFLQNILLDSSAPDLHADLLVLLESRWF